MKASTVTTLLDLNRRFYATFARPFAASRSSFEPGAHRALAWLADARSLLDVGCGDARLARGIRDGTFDARVVEYTGVDFSAPLMAAADTERASGTGPPRVTLLERDLAAAEWLDAGAVGRYDAAVAFSVLFHIPESSRRRRLVHDLARAVRPGGRVAISVWQFLHVPKLRAKVRDWREIGLDDADVEPGDLLVDWWRGGRGLRYVHHFTPEEIAALVTDAGLVLLDRFSSDGRTGDLGLFLIAERPGGGAD